MFEGHAPYAGKYAIEADSVRKRGRSVTAFCRQRLDWVALSANVAFFLDNVQIMAIFRAKSRVHKTLYDKSHIWRRKKRPESHAVAWKVIVQHAVLATEALKVNPRVSLKATVA